MSKINIDSLQEEHLTFKDQDNTYSESSQNEQCFQSSFHESEEEESEELEKQQKFLKFFHSFNEQQECKDILFEITQGFQQSFTKIKEKKELTLAPLKFLSKKDIQYLIRYWRQKQQREGNKDILNNQHGISLKNLGRRKYKDNDPNYIYSSSNKRQRKEQSSIYSNQDRTLAFTLIKDFEEFQQDQKIRILDGINNLLQQNKDLFYDTVHKQVNVNIQKACQLYQDHQQKDLLILMQSLSPLVIILLNVKMSLTNNQLTEESSTLFETLLPSLNSWYDYSFIEQKDHFIMNRFLNSLVKHIQDNNTEVQKGFMLFALQLDAQKIQCILKNEKNILSLSQALSYQGFSEQAILYFVNNPKKTIWGDTLTYLKGKEEHSILSNVQILCKLKIQNDPGNQLKSLNNIYAQRHLLVELLLHQQSIDLTIDNLIVVLENLKLLDSDTIKDCLSKDPKQWLKFSQVMLNSEEIFKEQVPEECLLKLYQEMTSKIEHPIQIEEMEKISDSISQECEMYKKNMYQCTISAILASMKEQFIIAIIPTGQGKTWIQGLLSKYYCYQKKKVMVVEPNDYLQIQTAEKISQIDFRINISKIDWLFQYINKDDILILNEYDDLLTNQSYMVINNTIYGSWLMKGKKVIAFSATSNPAIEKFINNTIAEPHIVKFPSQYELIHGVSNLQLGRIVASQSYEKMMEMFILDIKKYYDIKPIILIIDNDQTIIILDHLKKEKFKYLIGANENNIIEIRQWDYGILVLHSKEVRGVDSKFAKDGIVLIISQLENDIQYQQFIGRASRSQGLSEGILYNSNNENQNQLFQRLRKQNYQKYQQFEYLFKVIEKRQTNQYLIQAIKQAQQEGNEILSLEQLRTFMNMKSYQQLMKGITF